MNPSVPSQHHQNSGSEFPSNGWQSVLKENWLGIGLATASIKADCTEATSEFTIAVTPTVVRQ